MIDLETERRERGAVVEEARAWLNTPYHHMAAVKGSGVDCAMILREVYGNSVFPEYKDIQIEHYPPDWHMHRDDERYLDIVRQYAGEVDEPEPGDIVVVRYGRAFSHGGIVVQWPLCIHAYVSAGCVTLEDFEANKEIWGRPMKFFSPWEKDKCNGIG